MVTFNHPNMIVLAICLIPGFLIVSAVWRLFQNRTIGRFGQRKRLSRFSRFTRKTISAIALSLALGLMAIAAAEPTLSSSGNVNAPTLNAIIVVDISRSMLAEDGPGNASRLATGTQAIENLMESYPEGRFGLVIYTNAVFVYPPTYDHGAIRIMLGDILKNYSVRGEGSEPIIALHDAGSLIKELPYKIDTVILISDGGLSLVANADRPNEDTVASHLKNMGVHLVVGGVGGFIPVPIPFYGDHGELAGYYRYDGSVVYTSLDETALRRFASETSGWYIRLTSPDDLIQIVRSEHLDWQPTVLPTVVNLTWLPVVISILLVAFWLLGTMFRRPAR